MSLMRKYVRVGKWPAEVNTATLSGASHLTVQWGSMGRQLYLLGMFYKKGKKKNDVWVINLKDNAKNP